MKYVSAQDAIASSHGSCGRAPDEQRDSNVAVPPLQQKIENKSEIYKKLQNKNKAVQKAKNSEIRNSHNFSMQEPPKEKKNLNKKLIQNLFLQKSQAPTPKHEQVQESTTQSMQQSIN